MTKLRSDSHILFILLNFGVSERELCRYFQLSRINVDCAIRSWNNNPAGRVQIDMDSTANA